MIWQLPYAERKSILQAQQRYVDKAVEEVKDNEETDVVDEDDGFALAEETDLNEEELDLNVSRKMSIRALNVATMHKLRPDNHLPAKPAQAAMPLVMPAHYYPPLKQA